MAKRGGRSRNLLVAIGFFVAGVLVGALAAFQLAPKGLDYSDLVCSTYMFDISLRHLSGAPPYPCSVSCGFDPIGYCPEEAAIRLEVVGVAGPGLDAERAISFLDSAYVRMLHGEQLQLPQGTARYGAIELNVPCAIGILEELSSTGNLEVVRGIRRCLHAS